jgi:heme/copper-type cytochrome/quinol oxidase subunit 2
MRYVAVVAALLAVALAPARSLAQGCAMCATYLSNGQDPRADAFKISIMFLMAMPFTVVGLAGAWIAWMYRRRRPLPRELQALRAEGEGVS